MTTRVAVVGYGYWGSKHARVLASTSDVIVTIVDTSRARLAQAHSAFPAAQLASRLSDALPLVDAVVVATPPRTHAGLAHEALLAGRHVLVEKPLATSASECQSLIDSADDTGVVLMVGHTFEYNAAVRKLGELVDNGELGEICYIDAARLNLGLYQRDVNVIWDLAPHDISIINFLLGTSPVSVSAWGHPHATKLLEDVAYLRLRYSDPGLSAYVHVSWLDPCKVRRVTVVGTQKMAVYNDVSSTERVRIYDVGVQPSIEADAMHAMPTSYRYGDIVSPYIPFEEPLAVQDAHFIQCIRDGTTPRTAGTSGMEVVRVLEAASNALACGREVELCPSDSFQGPVPAHDSRRPNRDRPRDYEEVNA
ncbi:MAG: Gfo/Idh/MocA family protein [Acidimicrobiia bacterium]